MDVVIGEGSAVFKLLSGEDESLLVWGDTFLVLDLALDSFDGVRGLNVESDGFSGEGFNEDLHLLFSNYYKESGHTPKFKESVF